MKRQDLSIFAALLISSALFFSSSRAQGVEILVQTKANQGNAGIGESGISITTSALINVVVTDAGVLVDNLGNTNGNGTSSINLPAGWQVVILSNPPGACLFTFTEFGNPAGSTGTYSIRVVPFASNPSCTWLAGDYVYQVAINTLGFTGSGVGVLTIK